jgi:hypothetical protein
MPIIPATQEAYSRGLWSYSNQPGEKHKTPSEKKERKKLKAKKSWEHHSGGRRPA